MRACDFYGMNEVNEKGNVLYEGLCICSSVWTVDDKAVSCFTDYGGTWLRDLGSGSRSVSS